jgi:hypothetical protein
MKDTNSSTENILNEGILFLFTSSPCHSLLFLTLLLPAAKGGVGVTLVWKNIELLLPFVPMNYQQRH